MQTKSYSATVAWGTKERGRDIIEWVEQNCQSYDRVYGRPRDPRLSLTIENFNMEIWFHDEQEAILCQLKWA